MVNSFSVIDPGNSIGLHIALLNNTLNNHKQNIQCQSLYLKNGTILNVMRGDIRHNYMCKSTLSIVQFAAVFERASFLSSKYFLGGGAWHNDLPFSALRREGLCTARPGRGDDAQGQVFKLHNQKHAEI